MPHDVCAGAAAQSGSVRVEAQALYRGSTINLPVQEVSDMGEAVMTTRRQADGGIVVEVRGSLDAATVDALRGDLLGTLSAHRPVTMAVDLTYVTFMDSMGVGALVAGHNAARDTGTRFLLRNPSDFVRRQLQVTGLAEMFGVSGADPSPAANTAWLA